MGVTLCGGWVSAALRVKASHIWSQGNTVDCVCVTLWVNVSVSVTKEEDGGALPVIHPFSIIYFPLEHIPSPFSQCFSPLHFPHSLPLLRQEDLSAPLYFYSIFHCSWRMFNLPCMGKVQWLNRGETWHNMAKVVVSQLGGLKYRESPGGKQDEAKRLISRRMRLLAFTNAWRCVCMCVWAHAHFYTKVGSWVNLLILWVLWNLRVHFRVRSMCWTGPDQICVFNQMISWPLT